MCSGHQLDRNRSGSGFCTIRSICQVTQIMHEPPNSELRRAIFPKGAKRLDCPGKILHILVVSFWPFSVVRLPGVNGIRATRWRTDN